MSERPLWFDGCIIGAVFTTILLPNAMHAGLGMTLANLLAIACFVVPLVMGVREGDLRKD